MLTSNPPVWFSFVLRGVPLAFALNGLLKFAFAMRWEHVSFGLLDSIVLSGSSVVFAWLMGWLD